ncbi:uncharacterized protein BO80DRAFT_423103 [Aspergillus ibericus CBS 121593]|uniref:Uncharacterized protein n=1 Tax=Aspergillus ibericus CBS 121593 TaxID=1448316 RepID=A0A395H657_9EURO|nr:hypothetical protein BO80DRAFT_423103 [Aspergillus ibericus CBS 121593]RAL03100.1 hypothetical protein BO80DRAFT_423103 [Aspergillus ibericus CBS 121593]
MVRAFLDMVATAHAATQKLNNDPRKPTGLDSGSPWAGQPLYPAAMGVSPDIC